MATRLGMISSDDRNAVVARYLRGHLDFQRTGHYSAERGCNRADTGRRASRSTCRRSRPGKWDCVARCGSFANVARTMVRASDASAGIYFDRNAAVSSLIASFLPAPRRVTRPIESWPPPRASTVTCQPARDRPLLDYAEQGHIQALACRSDDARRAQALADEDAAVRRPPSALAGLWWAAKKNWDKAHKLVMDEGGKDCAWVHAYLHRLEGDKDNADTGTIARAAGRPPARCRRNGWRSQRPCPLTKR